MKHYTITYRTQAGLTRTVTIQATSEDEAKAKFRAQYDGRIIDIV